MGADEQRGNPVRVLIVEDHPALALALSELLGRDDRVIVVGCVSTMADALAEQTIELADVVLSDVHLTGGTGVELARELRGLRPDLPVIVMSGSGDEQTMDSALDAGAFAYLEKGRVLDEVVELILAAAEFAVR